MQLVRPERYGEFLSALLTLVHRGITTQLSNTAGAGEQVGRRAARPGWHAGGRAGLQAAKAQLLLVRLAGCLARGGLLMVLLFPPHACLHPHPAPCRW